MLPTANDIPIMNVHKNGPRKEETKCLRKEEEKPVAPPEGLGIRHLQTAVMAVAAFIAFSLRTNLNVSIVAMVQLKDDSNATTTPPLGKTYDWDERTQGYILSSFFVGYLIPQIPAGILTGRFGGHRFMYSSTIVTGLLSLGFPQCVYIGGWELACANRILVGTFQGFIFPSVFTLLGVWAPPNERGFLSSIAIGAQLLGTVVTTPLSGYLCDVAGWPSVFYVVGGVAVALGVAMIFLGADNPHKHKMISEAEMRYIQSSLGGAKEKLLVPWGRILVCIPFWSALIANGLHSFAYLTLLTEVPTYLGTVLKFNIKTNGLLSAVPYFVSWCLTFFFSRSCDLIIIRQWLTPTVTRKLYSSLALYGGALFVILLAYATTPSMSVILLTSFMGVLAAHFTGVQANFIDIAPNFSGSIYSVSSCVNACLGFVGPNIVGFIVTEKGDASQWKIVFFIFAGALILGNTAYLFAGSAKTQWWNWPNKGKPGMYQSGHDEDQIISDAEALLMAQREHRYPSFSN